jgi:Flp pilus assembly protein TadG
MRKPRRRGSVIGGEAGAAIVEMAFVLPVFLLLTFGIFEFGRAWLTVNTMNHATREAVRLAAVTTPLVANDTAVVNKVNTILGNAGLTGATVTNTAPAATTPPSVTVNTTLNFSFMTGFGPFFGFTFPPVAIALNSSATMFYER